MNTESNQTNKDTEMQVRRSFAGLTAESLAQMTVSQFLGQALNILFESERKLFLQESPDDKGNGAYRRQVVAGSLPLEVDVPRVRSGTFRPSLLPEKYARGFTDEMQALLTGLLASSRSVSAAKNSLSRMGLPYSGKDLDTVAKEFIEMVKLKNAAPLPADLLALYADVKLVDVREEDKVYSSSLYTVVGILPDGSKRVLLCKCINENENLDGWRTVFKNILERGLRRVLLVIHDDFSGLAKLSKSFFPQSDIQLCVVHMLRNSRVHLGSELSRQFKDAFMEARNSTSFETAKGKFDKLLSEFETHAPSFIQHLRTHQDAYIQCTKYPRAVRGTLSTTNAVEAVNGQLERLRRNSGGYFQSADSLLMKLGITFDVLETTSWKKTSGNFQTSLTELKRLHAKRFEE
jgi:transposase-like protein